MIVFLFLFLACYNLLLGRAQFLWSHVIACVCVLPSLMCYIFVVSAWLCVWDRVVACECVYAQLCERLNCVLFVFLLPLLMCYTFIARVRVRSRACTCVIIFVSACNRLFLFFSLPSLVCYMLLWMHAQFLWAPTILFFFYHCWCVIFLLCVIACEIAWLHALTHAP